MMFMTTTLRETLADGVASVLRRFVWTMPFLGSVVVVTYYPVPSTTNTVKIYPRPMARHMYNSYLACGHAVEDKMQTFNSEGMTFCNEMSTAVSMLRLDAP